MSLGLHHSLVSRASRIAFGCSSTLGGSRLSILIFHRVLSAPDPLLPDEVHAARFENLMALVARSFNVVSLGRALEYLAAGRLPRRSLVITFDDGYADNARVALPILRRQGLVATFFVSTGFVDGGRMWNDTVIEAVRRATTTTLEVPDLGLGTLPLIDDASRRAAIGALLPRVKYLLPEPRLATIGGLIERLKPSHLPDDLMMSTEQVRDLHAAGMELGAHTVNHPILASLSAEEAMREIVEGRDQLSRMIRSPVNVMAYPNGVPERDFRSEHVAMLKRAGFLGAVTTAPGVARVGDDPFQLPRFTPWDRALWRWSARLLMNQRNIDFAAVATA